MDAAAAPAPRGFGAQYDPRGPVAGYGSPSAAPSAGTGVAGAVVGGLAGVAAGYALSRALDSRDEPPAASHPATGRSADPMEEVGLVRMDSPGQDDTLGGFDAGNGDNWGPSGDSDSDSW